jgi:hypothetical protein
LNWRRERFWARDLTGEFAGYSSSDDSRRT